MNEVSKQSFRKKLKNTRVIHDITGYIRKNTGVIIGLVLICIIVAVGSKNFLTISNILNVLRQISINALISFGMTYVILIGGIDLTVGSLVALSGVIIFKLLALGVHPALAVLSGLLSGAISGFICSLLVTKGNLPPFIATLSVQTILRGIAYLLTGGSAVRTEVSDFVNFIGNGHIWQIPVSAIIMFVIMIIMAFILNKTKLGRHIYAVGGNEEAAVYSGINVERVNMIVYMISGVLAATSGLILASKMYSGQPTVGQGYEADAIAASVLAGVSFTGGVGTIGGTILGVLIIGVLSNGMNLLSLSSYWQYVMKGIVIIAAVMFDLRKKKNRI